MARRLPAGARQRAALVVERLRDEYPVVECALVFETPLQLLVATILSAQCTDERVNMVTPILFARFPGVKDLAGAGQEELEEVIRSTGFFRMKSRAIRDMAQDLVDKHAGEVPPRMEDLVALRGVGRKTANVVLGVAFDLPGLPVDTHVTRLVGRLRLSSSVDAVQIETDVCGMVQESSWTALSLRLIVHGRRVCVARKPRCLQCVLNDICPSAQLGPLQPKPRPTPRRPAGGRAQAAVPSARTRRPSAS